MAIGVDCHPSTMLWTVILLLSLCGEGFVCTLSSLFVQTALRSAWWLACNNHGPFYWHLLAAILLSSKHWIVTTLCHVGWTARFACAVYYLHKLDDDPHLHWKIVPPSWLSKLWRCWVRICEVRSWGWPLDPLCSSQSSYGWPVKSSRTCGLFSATSQESRTPYSLHFQLVLSVLLKQDRFNYVETT